MRHRKEEYTLPYQTLCGATVVTAAELQALDALESRPLLPMTAADKKTVAALRSAGKTVRARIIRGFYGNRLRVVQRRTGNGKWIFLQHLGMP